MITFESKYEGTTAAEQGMQLPDSGVKNYQVSGDNFRGE